MTLSRGVTGLLYLATAIIAAGCAHGTRIAAVPVPPAAPVERPPDDPVQRLISEADGHLEAGLAQLKDGHLNHARSEFDLAVDTYLTAPGGAYANERLTEAYRRTLEAVHVRELESLAAGDGFTERLPEPASIDEVGDLAATAEATPPSEETRRTTQEVVEQETNDLPIELNDAVLACIELYQGRLRDWFSAALERGGRYLPFIRETFASEGIPQDLAYVALVESAFKTTALSRAKAKGVWQFISATGKRYGLQQDWWVDERSDPEKATRAAAQYLKELYGMFGDWNLALAGYNAGEMKVVRGLNRYGASDYWSLRQTRALRRETKNYVPLIHAAIVVAKSPEKYGFEVTPEPALEFETIPVKGAIDLRLVAECAEAEVERVQSLNPQLRRLATPADRTFSLRVPPGRGSDTQKCLDQVPPEKRVRFRTHVVTRGQTLASIAQRYGAPARDIAQANGLSLKKRLPVATELIIPIDPRAKAVAPRRTASETTGPKTPDLPAASSASQRVTYRIRPGDTLGSIASQHGTTVQDIQNWNGLRSSRIAAGGTLTLYTRPPARSDPRRHAAGVASSE